MSPQVVEMHSNAALNKEKPENKKQAVLTDGFPFHLLDMPPLAKWNKVLEPFARRYVYFTLTDQIKELAAFLRSSLPRLLGTFLRHGE